MSINVVVGGKSFVVDANAVSSHGGLLRLFCGDGVVDEGGVRCCCAVQSERGQDCVRCGSSAELVLLESGSSRSRYVDLAPRDGDVSVCHGTQVRGGVGSTHCGVRIFDNEVDQEKERSCGSQVFEGAKAAIGAGCAGYGGAYSSTRKEPVSQRCRAIQFGCFPGAGSTVGDECGAVTAVGDGSGSSAVAVGVVGPKKGKHFERNLRKKQNRKLSKASSVPVWRAGAGPGNAGKVVGSGEPVQSSKGFWNSCTESVRRQLIESKAKMHVAENERKEAEAKARVQYLSSPEALLRKAVDLQLFAEKQAAAVTNERVGGWAKTVANASAENLARSAPSSVPSFDEVVKELDSISQAEAERVRVAYQAEKDAIEAKVDAVQSEKDAVQAENDALLAEKNAVDLRVATLLEKISSLEVTRASQASSETLVNARIAQLESELAVRRKAGDLDYKAKFFKVSHEKCALEEKLARIGDDPVVPVRRTIPVKKGWFGN